MALYLGSSEKVKVILNGVVYYLNLFTTNPITNGIKLLSSDNYILRDSNGRYLTVNEDGYITIVEDNDF